MGFTSSNRAAFVVGALVAILAGMFDNAANGCAAGIVHAANVNNKNRYKTFVMVTFPRLCWLNKNAP